jgi:RNA polymerase sigma-70 factor (ECF subfamily)
VTEQELLEKHSALVFNLALRLTGNRSDAEDLAQDALLRALRALPGFRGDSLVSTWLYRITVNSWKNRVRSEKRRAFWRTVTLGLITGEDRDGPARELPDHAAPIDAELETAERSTAVQKALLELDADDRAIVVLRDVEDRSYGEIGTVLGLPEGTVKSRLSRARAKLKTLLEKAGAPR